MWEYAVLSEKVIDSEKKHVIIHADSSGLVKGFLKVECEDQVSKEAAGMGIISRVEGNIAIMCYVEAKWDAEEPLFSSPFSSIPKIDEIRRAIAIWNNDEQIALERDDDGNIHQDYHDEMDKLWTKVLGTRMSSVEWIVEGEFTQPIYEADRVTQVLSLAGADGWELVGNIPGGDQRMLRRMKK